MIRDVSKDDLELARNLVAFARKRRQSWQEVADHYGMFSKAAYWRLVRDPKYHPPLVLVEHVILKGVPGRIVPLSIPDGFDAEVYMIPGKDRLRLHAVPDGAKVVMRQPSKPTRPRRDTGCVRYDKTRTTKTPAEIKEFIYGP